MKKRAKHSATPARRLIAFEGYGGPWSEWRAPTFGGVLTQSGAYLAGDRRAREVLLKVAVSSHILLSFCTPQNAIYCRQLSAA